MKIRTQFIMSMVVFGVMLLIIAASIVVTNRQVERLNKQEETAKKVERAASELGLLSNDYLIYYESQQRARWESKFSELSDYLSNLNPDSPEQQALVSNIKANQQRLKAVFTDIASAYENRPLSAVAAPAFQTLWSRMTVQNQGMAFDAERLAQASRDRVRKLEQTNLILIFALLGIFGAYFFTNYFLIFRRTFKSLSDLQAGIGIIGSGNLDYSIEMNRPDEIGELSSAFNRMTVDLKGATASKSELEREITDRKQAEEALRKAYDELELRVQERTKELTEAEKELRENNVTLEQRVAERTAELQAAIDSLRDSRRAAFNLMEDSVAARRQAEEASAELRREVAERKQAEADVLKLSEDMAARNVELEAVNRELEAFIYSISHDLRAPLRSMAGFARILVEDYAGRLDEQARDYLTRIHRGSEKMTRLIDDLLHLSKISRQEADKMNIDISRLASSVVSELRQAEPSRSVEVSIAGGLGAFADLQLMEIVLTNLLGNAWKFTSKMENARIEFGAIDCGLQIADCGIANEKSEVRNPTSDIFYVRDNGAGFDPEYAERMFWPFHRLHSDKEFEGTGIGLTIVERIIRRHGGKVWAEGEVGKGATVYFTLGDK